VKFNKRLKICTDLFNKIYSDENRKMDFFAKTHEEQKLIEKYNCDEFDGPIEYYWDVVDEGCNWYCGASAGNVTASSFLKPQGKINYEPENAHDLNLKNVWSEGVSGYGIGEYLIYHFNYNHPRITTIYIANGYVKSNSAWKNNSRVKKLKMYINDKPYAILNLKDERANQSFIVNPIGNNPSETWDNEKDCDENYNWTIKFEILEVYKGDKYDDVVISEIFFSGLDVHCLGKGTLITMADSSIKKIEDLKIDDLILSLNKKSKLYEPAKIERLANPIHFKLSILTLSNGQKLTCTKDHPLLSSKGNWLSLNPIKTMTDYNFESIGLLTVGSKIQGIDKSKSIIITEIKEILKKQVTYTIVKLDKNNSFIANGVLVGTEELKINTYANKK